MADAFDLAWEKAAGGGTGGADPFDAAWQRGLERSGAPVALGGPKEPPPGVFGSLWEGVKAAPRTFVDFVKQIPDVADTVVNAPMYAGQVGLDLGRVLRSRLTGEPIVGSPAANYPALEQKARTIAGLGAGLAGGAVGTTFGGLPGGAAGGSAAMKGLDKILQVFGASPQTTPEEDANQLAHDFGTFLTLGMGGKAIGKTAKVTGDAIARNAEPVAQALDRKSLGARAGDYGRQSDLRTIDLPAEVAEGQVQTIARAALDDLLKRGELGKSRNPAVISKVIDTKSRALSSEIDAAIRGWEKNNRSPVMPSFENALSYLTEGKVPADQIGNYFARLEKISDGIQKEGGGRLSFIQQQKVALGKSWDPTDAVKSGFDRAIYKDLQTTIEQKVPEVKGLNAELGKFKVADPIVQRQLRLQESASPLSKVRDVVYTTGGIGAPTIAGSVIGGPAGALVGAGVGLAGKALATPSGQAAIARGLRSAAKLTESLKSTLGPATSGAMSAERPLFEIERSAPSKYAHIEEAALQKLKSGGQMLIDKYLQENTKEGVVRLDPDLARPYISDSNVAVATHEAASALTKAAWRASLKDPAFNRVVVRSGPPGAGKSAAIEFIKPRPGTIIYDKIVKNIDQGSKIIEEALSAGKEVVFQTVFAAPKVALRRAWGRALKGDRAVPLEHFADRPQATAKAHIGLSEKYSGSPRVSIIGLDNSVNGRPPTKLSLEDVRILSYNKGGGSVENLLKTLSKELERLRSDGGDKAQALYEQFNEAPRGGEQSGSTQVRRGDSRAVDQVDSGSYKAQERPALLGAFGAFSNNKEGDSDQRPIKSIFGKKRGSMPEKAQQVSAVEAQIDAEPYYSALYETESGRNPSAKNPKSTASGGFQFINATAKSMGLKNPMDLGESFEAVKRFTDQHRAMFGDDPLMLYRAHFLGATLLKKLLAGKRLTASEQAIVEDLNKKALPRFKRIYERIASRGATLV